MTEVSCTRRLVKPATILSVEDSVATAVAELRASDVRALPVADARGRMAGVFGEREFFTALFPGYVSDLRSAAFVPAALDETIEHRASSAGQAVGRFMTTDHVDVPLDASDLELAEIFLHHRVLIAPVIDGGRIVGVVDRQDFFETLAGRFLDRVGRS